MNVCKSIGFTFLMTLFVCCTADDENTQEQEAQYLTQLLTEIEMLAASENCNVSSEWTFTSYGSKACGGPTGYIAYSRTIDVDSFLAKIEKHKTAEQEFNVKWAIVSDCAFATSPTAVNCENGKPVLEY